MGLPSKKSPKSGRKFRAPNYRVKRLFLSICAHCKKMILPHRVCPHCGYFQGRLILKVRTKLERRKEKERREKVKERKK